MLLTDEYKAQLQAVHGVDTTWGTTARKWAHLVQAYIDEHKYDTVLDYGCGKGLLAAKLDRCAVTEYDPGIPGKDTDPARPFDLVVCLDVLEHIEPDCLDAVLAHIRSLAWEGLYANVALYPAGTWLPDGRNAHLIVESERWWKRKLTAAFPDWELDFYTHVRPTRKNTPKNALIVRGKRKP